MPHWIENIVEQIIGRQSENVVLCTGKTPSGPIHIGSEREIFICDSIKRVLAKRGIGSQLIFVIDSFDPLKAIPAGLDVPKDFSKNIGKPMCDVPDVYSCHRSYAEHFAEEFVLRQPDFGVEMEAIYSHELYRTKEMKEAIRLALAKLDVLKEIRREFVMPTLDPAHRKKFEQEEQFWSPAMVVCENCGMLAPKVGGEIKPNRVLRYDPKEDAVHYRCNHCGFKGAASVNRGRIKLSWRVDWAAKWFILRVTCEPAGKDHCVKGGAYDMALEVSRKVFGYVGPLKVPYEWLTLGEHAMKTHKGIIFTPSEWLSVAPPETLRMFILSTDPMRHISFSPGKIPELVDLFDRLERFYYGLEKLSLGEPDDSLLRLYELSLVNAPKPEPPARLPYRFAIYLVQLEELLGLNKVVEKSAFVALKLYRREKLSDDELLDIRRRLQMAKNWVSKYAPIGMKFNISREVAGGIKSKLGERQRIFLLRLADLIQRKEYFEEQELQNKIFDLAREIALSPNEAFKAVYLAVLGSDKGPRLAPLMLALDRDWLIKRLMEAAS